VFVRGNARFPIAVEDADFDRGLFLLEQTKTRFELVCHAWCLLPNHAHFLVTSQLGNLSRAMHWLGTCSAQSFNRRHARSGHLYQGRFGSRLVEDDEYFLELTRYLPLNPVRAGLCQSPGDWQWSSYAATAGLRRAPWFLDPSTCIQLLGSTGAYVDWVARGVDPAVLDEDGLHQPPQPPLLPALLAEASVDAIIRAQSFGYSLAAIADHLGVSRRTISRRLAAHSGV